MITKPFAYCMLKIHGGHAWTIKAAQVDVAFLDAAEKDKFCDAMIAIGKLPKKFLAERSLFEFACADS